VEIGYFVGKFYAQGSVHVYARIIEVNWLSSLRRITGSPRFDGRRVSN
jgi:hypothetical protein